MRVATPIFAVLFLTAAASAQAAGPYTASLGADVYDPAPNAVPTPNQFQDPPGTDIHNAINALLGTTFSHNSEVDQFQFTGTDETWIDNGSVGNPVTLMVINIASGNESTQLVYDVNGGPSHDVFGGGFSGLAVTGDGTNLAPFPVTSSPLTPGTNFGFRLTSADIPSGVIDNEWDSDPTQNPDGLDHMLTYHLPSLKGKTVYTEDLLTGTIQEYTFEDPYLIAWEDLPYRNGKLGDEDYNDLAVLVDRAVPVPEPMSLALLGGGLAGAFAWRRRKS